MRRILFLASLASIEWAMGVTPVAGQIAAPPKISISPRAFVAGSLTVVVRGAVRFEKEIPINTVASFGDGGMTWLQYGDSGSAEPNVGVTFSSYEVGISVGRGRFIATGGLIPGERSECTGKTDVTPSSVFGEYKCTGLVSYEPGGSGTGRVDIEVRFNVTS